MAEKRKNLQYQERKTQYVVNDEIDASDRSYIEASFVTVFLQLDRRFVSPLARYSAYSHVPSDSWRFDFQKIIANVQMTFV